MGLIDNEDELIIKYVTKHLKVSKDSILKNGIFYPSHELNGQNAARILSDLEQTVGNDLLANHFRLSDFMTIKTLKEKVYR